MIDQLDDDYGRGRIYRPEWRRRRRLLIRAWDRYCDLYGG